MNQRGSMNQRSDEIERILNASKVNYLFQSASLAAAYTV